MVRQESASRIERPSCRSRGWKKRKIMKIPGKMERKMKTRLGRKTKEVQGPWLYRIMSNWFIQEGKKLVRLRRWSRP